MTHIKTMTHGEALDILKKHDIKMEGHDANIYDVAYAIVVLEVAVLIACEDYPDADHAANSVLHKAVLEIGKLKEVVK